jgi:hypothetical protein
MADRPMTEREEEMAQAMSAMQAKIDAFENAVPTPAPAQGRKAPRAPTPDKYNGPPKGDVAVFIMQLILYVAGCGNDAERIIHASSLLTGSAFKWHVAHGRNYKKFDDYCEALQVFGTDPRKYERAVSKLRRCLQNGRKILQYNNDFTATVLDLAGWPENVLLDFYLDGLDSQVRSHVEARGKPTGVIDAQRAAGVASCEGFTAPTPITNKQYNNQKPQQQLQQAQRRVRFQEPQPMEIGSMQRAQQATKKPSVWPPPHPPSTPCTVCGKGLHWSVNCPVVKAASSN